jgi:hypothetical protein
VRDARSPHGRDLPGDARQLEQGEHALLDAAAAAAQQRDNRNTSGPGEPQGCLDAVAAGSADRAAEHAEVERHQDSLGARDAARPAQD